MSDMTWTRKQVLNLPQHLATRDHPADAQELWLVPLKRDTVVIGVDVRRQPSHRIVAYAGVLEMHVSPMVRIATEHVGRLGVVRLRVPHGALRVLQSQHVTTIVDTTLGHRDEGVQ